MTTTHRALTLTIDANSKEDMVMLLKQAMYEIERLLPPPHDASYEERNRAAVAAFVSSGPRKLISEGHSTGSIGSYSFQFLHCSRAFNDLEQQLFAAGYSKEASGSLFGPSDYYVHPTLPAKVIQGNPMTIGIKEPSQD